MDILYYNNQIRDELDGACDYIQRAIDCKGTNSNHASTFAKMSEMELEHASELLGMFKEDYSKEATSDSIYPQIKQLLLNMYAESYAKVKYMQELYKDM